MRSDLPSAIIRALEGIDRAALLFDAARIDANARAFAAAARAAGITVLFAAKSFPHPEARRLAIHHFDGFDAASRAELAELPPARILSIADPTGRAVATGPLTSQRVIVSCETVEQVRAAPLHAEIAIRISASVTGRDPAIGIVQEGTGHRRSRFGLDVEPARRAALVRDFVAAAAGRPVGLHVHHGPVTAASSERFVATARVLLATAADAELAPRFLNLGGAWHAIADLDLALREVREAVPRDIEVIVEPGRALADAAGFACGRVTVARELDDRTLRVVDLSRICHLRWSHVELVGAAPRANLGRHVLIAGPTCFEDDVIGEWIVEDELPIGARVIVRHVTGYAIAWNTGFHGVPPADVVVV